MKSRIEGATKPGYTADVVDDTGTVITDGLTYTWTCDAARTGGTMVHIWTKTTGITSTASGFDVVWTAGDMGALTAVSGAPTSYLLEFTGTSSGGSIKHQDTVVIKPQIT